MDKKTPVNTTKQHPMSFVRAAFALGTSDAIEAQEAAGQVSLIESDTLPIEMSAKDAAALQSFGVQFGEPVHGDALFRYVELPKGWKKLADEHAMWSDLVDERGRKRAAIFYKAAFYDRKASLTVLSRFSVSIDWEQRKKNVAVAAAKDGEAVVFVSSSRPRDSYSVEEACMEEARAWLDQNWPKWREVTAYWDSF